MKIFWLLLFLFVWKIESQNIPDEDWGYVEVDSQNESFMFWWFYGATQTPRLNSPLVLWLQGGPGASSWFGDLGELGPFDPYLNKRKYAWSNTANLMFIDNPVGAGFSYSNKGGFSTTEQQVAAHLLIVLQAFFTKYPVYSQQQIPFWIFAESYGPKYATYLALLLDQVIKENQLHVNFQGVGLGDGWLAPMICVRSYGNYLKAFSLVNEFQYEQVEAVTDEVEYMVAQGEYVKAGDFVDNWVQGPFLEQFSADIYNVIFSPPSNYFEALSNDLAIGGPIRNKLKIIPMNVTWGGQSGSAGSGLYGDFLKPAYSNVDSLLNEGYQVVVYNGQYDLVVDILCTQQWIQELSWEQLPYFNLAPREPISINGTISGYKQSFQNFSFWNILKAGHLVPLDAPQMAYYMFNSVIYPNMTEIQLLSLL